MIEQEMTNPIFNSSVLIVIFNGQYSVECHYLNALLWNSIVFLGNASFKLMKE